MTLGMIVLVVIVIILMIIVVSKYNSMVRMKLLVDNAKSQISVQLKSRWDLVENLIAATGKYSEHEKSTLMDVVKLRTHVSSKSSPEDLGTSEAELSSVLNKLAVVVEAYPDLKASSIYQETMNTTKEMEEDVKMSRMVYNDTATKYNRLIAVFPNVVFAGILGFKPADLISNSEQENHMPQW